MEINNNSLYLHKCEDKSDNNDKRMQCENKFSQSVSTVKSGFTGEKLASNSLERTIDIEIMSVSEEKMIKENIESNQEVISSIIDEIRVTDELINITGNETIAETINDSKNIKCADEAPFVEEPTTEVVKPIGESQH